MSTLFNRRQTAPQIPVAVTPSAHDEPAQFPRLIWHTPALDLTAPYEQTAVPFAIDRNGAAVAWAPAVDPHAVFVGAAGTGVSTAVRTVITDLALRRWKIWVVDGNGVELLGFRGWPNIQIVASRLTEQIAVIRRAHEELTRRFDAIENGADEREFVPMLLVIHDYSSFRAVLAHESGRHGPTSRPQTLFELATIQRKGLEARIHILFAERRYTAEFSSGTVDFRDDVLMRASFGRLNPAAAFVLWGSPTISDNIPYGVRGRALVFHQGEPVEVQSKCTPDPRRMRADDEMANVLAQLRPESVTHEPLSDLTEPDQAEKY